MTKSKTTKKKAVKKKISKKKSAKKPKEDNYITRKEELLDRSLERIQKLEEIHHQHLHTRRVTDSFAYFLFLGLVLVTNFLVSFLLVFFVISLRNSYVYLIAGILGLSFGILYEELLHGLRHTHARHHVFAKIFLLFTGAITAYFIVKMSTMGISLFGFTNVEIDIFLVSIIYFFFYVVPYFLVRAYRVSS